MLCSATNILSVLNNSKNNFHTLDTLSIYIFEFDAPLEVLLAPLALSWHRYSTFHIKYLTIAILYAIRDFNISLLKQLVWDWSGSKCNNFHYSQQTSVRHRTPALISLRCGGNQTIHIRDRECAKRMRYMASGIKRHPCFEAFGLKTGGKQS